MSEVIVVAKAKAQPGKEAALEAALKACVTPTHAEAGCVRYALHRGADDPALFVVVERWTSRADLDRHLGSAHVATLFMAAPHLVSAPPEILILNGEPFGDAVKGKL
jgi:quinol monooxygenase YgiN